MRISLQNITEYDDIYFNAFSIGKWVQYTGILNLRLVIFGEGFFVIRLYHAEIKGDEKDIDIALISETAFGHADKEAELSIDVPLFDEGIIYFDVCYASYGSRFISANYVTDCDYLNDVRIGINICTYRRTDYLKRNIELIRKEILGDGDRFRIFITDNASELDPDMFEDPRIALVHNKNTGGAGGFGRGLCEIRKYNKSALDANKITHVMFMDDDATIYPESIKRTYSLLQLLKPEYQGAFISGAMLRSEDPNIQHENGALWNEGNCRYIGRGADLRDLKNIITNELQYERDYAAWWYCCVPLDHKKKMGMPAPVFIHGDDIEYSLRNAEGIITMNGIAVAHPASLNRRISSNEYYNLRNMLIINAVYCPKYGTGKALWRILTGLSASLLRHRYRDMKLIREAVKDYLKGPKWLKDVDAEELNKEVSNIGHRFSDVSDIVKEAEDKGLLTGYTIEDDREKHGFKYLWKNAGSVWKRICLIGRLITFNGWLLPRKRKQSVCLMSVHPADLYRTGDLVLYDDADNMGLILPKRFGQIFVLLGYFIEIMWLLTWKNRKVRKDYKREWHNIVNDPGI